MTERCALVTGGSRGIGRGIVLALAQAGWKVVFSYRSDAAAAEETVQASADAQRVRACRADVTQAEDRARLLETCLEACDGINLLVNNAGMAPRKRADLLEMTEESYDEVMQTNLKGPLFLTQAVARQMIRQTHPGNDLSGMIINIGSMSAYTSSINRAEYCLSKAGLGMLTQVFADRLAVEGILVYEIRPGIIATDMTAPVSERYDRLIADGLLPIARWGKAEDVGKAVVALAEGALPYSTGEVINIDGGFHIRRL